jgi:CheY-like chemotaxis protein
MDKSQARRLKDLERENTRLIPNVVLTSSEEEHDIVESYQLGIDSYIVKERKKWKGGYYVRQQSFSG